MKGQISLLCSIVVGVAAIWVAAAPGQGAGEELGGDVPDFYLNTSGQLWYGYFRGSDPSYEGEECYGRQLVDCDRVKEFYGISCTGGDIYVALGNSESEGWSNATGYTGCWGDSACGELSDIQCLGL